MCNMLSQPALKSSGRLRLRRPTNPQYGFQKERLVFEHVVGVVAGQRDEGELRKHDGQVFLEDLVRFNERDFETWDYGNRARSRWKRCLGRLDQWK